ncbi:unnamed protein product [Caenorhabditis brenneri]
MPPPPKNKFKLIIPFHRLPLLVQVQAIQTMDPKDWVNLALTSKRNERVVKLARIKTEYFRVEFCHDACIQLPFYKLVLYYDKHYGRTKKTWGMFTREDMKTWLNQPSNSMIENAVVMYQKIQNIFVIPKELGISYCTDIEKKKRATIRELLSNPVMKNWRELSVYGKKISSEDLKMIMDRATLDRHFELKVEEMPSDFKHENAFKFASQDYHDSRWVRIEDLYGLKNSINVTLLRSNFTQEQIKTFVNYWVNSEVDMFLWMRIETNDRTHFESLVDGFLGLRCNKTISNNFFMLSTTTSSSRKDTMLAISCHRNDLVLTAWAENENYQAIKDLEELNKLFRNLREILTKLHEKKELEDLWKVGSEEEKIDLKVKIEDAIAELKKLKVVFRNGKAWLI